MKAPEIPVSWGELIDKVTILEIKRARLTNAAALSHVCMELSLLQAKLNRDILDKADVRLLKTKLFNVNEALWNIEDEIRQKESKIEFDEHFVELARSVYKRNDERAAIKKQINELLGSEIVEEKSYHQY